MKKIAHIKLVYSFILILFCLSIIYSCEDEITNSNNFSETIIDAFPNWSPQGRQILYAGGSESKGFSLFIIDTNGANKQMINSTSYLEVDFSPDGQWIVYSHGGQIFKRKLSDTLIVQLTFKGNNYLPSWSSDGEWIAFDTNNDSPNGMKFVWKMKADGTNKKRIIYSPLVGEVRRPDWFPDGVRLAVIRYTPRHNGRPQIAIIDTAGNSISFLTNDEKVNRSPKVSGDGNFIVYYRDDNNGQICIVRADGSDHRQITYSNTVYPNWSPDGRMITFTNSTENDGRIWIMKKDGTLAKKISY